jgi:hypothetical protein
MSFLRAIRSQKGSAAGTKTAMLSACIKQFEPATAEPHPQTQRQQ